MQLEDTRKKGEPLAAYGEETRHKIANGSLKIMIIIYSFDTAFKLIFPK